MRFLFISVLLLAVFVPTIAFAQSSGFVTCDGVNEECTACHLVALVQSVLNFLVMVSVFVGVLMFSWAGILMVIAAGDTGKIEKAKGIFTAVAIGFVIVLSAWLIIDTLMKTLFREDAYQGFGPWNEIRCTESGVRENQDLQQGGNIDVSDRSEDSGCPNCIALDSSLLPVKSRNACAGDGPCSVSAELGMKLVELNAGLEEDGIDWRITEAYPPTVRHQAACHSNGTCIDANFGPGQHGANSGAIKQFIQRSNEAGLRAVYEVSSKTTYHALIANGVPSSNLIYEPRITGPHFSVYND